jgi:hypothetical protein
MYHMRVMVLYVVCVSNRRKRVIQLTLSHQRNASDIKELDNTCCFVCIVLYIIYCNIRWRCKNNSRLWKSLARVDGYSTSRRDDDVAAVRTLRSPGRREMGRPPSTDVGIDD